MPPLTNYQLFGYLVGNIGVTLAYPYLLSPYYCWECDEFYKLVGVNEQQLLELITGGKYRNGVFVSKVRGVAKYSPLLTDYEIAATSVGLDGCALNSVIDCPIVAVNCLNGFGKELEKFYRVVAVNNNKVTILSFPGGHAACMMDGNAREIMRNIGKQLKPLHD